MRKTIATLVILGMMAFAPSCKKEDHIRSQAQAIQLSSIESTRNETHLSGSTTLKEKPFVLKTKPLSLRQIQGIAEKLRGKVRKKISTNRIDIIEEVPIDGTTPISDDVSELERILNPLVENGKQIHRELLANISWSEDWLALTDDERHRIRNLSNDQLGELSLIYSTTNLEEFQREPIGDIEPMNMLDLDMARNCISAALGLGELYYLVVENPKALLSAKGAVKILKHVGLRYLGWVGLGLAVWDFVDCMRNEQ